MRGEDDPIHGPVERPRRITPACAGKTRPPCGIDVDVLGSLPHARGRPDLTVPALAGAGITPACAGKTLLQCSNPVPEEDHPRMRGEDRLPKQVGRMISGSPPHARGRLMTFSWITRGGRITPACAGKTRLSRDSIGIRQDHPRMRGEDFPPSCRRRVSARITPACAGKTSGSGSGVGVSADHPRMRGEDKFVGNINVYDVGSPPHARGRHSYSQRRRRAVGITPACAGKTLLYGGGF